MPFLTLDLSAARFSVSSGVDGAAPLVAFAAKTSPRRQVFAVDGQQERNLRDANWRVLVAQQEGEQRKASAMALLHYLGENASGDIEIEIDVFVAPSGFNLLWQGAYSTDKLVLTLEIEVMSAAIGYRPEGPDEFDLNWDCSITKRLDFSKAEFNWSRSDA